MDRTEKIIEIVRNVGDMMIDPDTKITPDMNIASDLGLDSLDMVMILGSIEETFGVAIENDDVQSIRTISDINKKLNELLGE